MFAVAYNVSGYPFYFLLHGDKWKGLGGRRTKTASFPSTSILMQLSRGKRKKYYELTNVSAFVYLSSVDQHFK